MSHSSPSGVVISGLYGTGKSTVAEEIADQLESTGVPYGALDLDWLWWFGVPGMQRSDALPVLFDNLSAVVATYRRIGIDRFVMAWSLRDASDLAGLRAALPFPVNVVELTAPLHVIEARLGSAVAAGRENDLRAARRWHREGLGVGFGDIQIANDGPISDTARKILEWLGWS